MSRIEQIRQQLAASYDQKAFLPLTTTYDFPTAFREQRERQRRAYEVADEHIRTVVSAVVKDDISDEAEPVN